MNMEMVLPVLAAAVQAGTPIFYATVGEILMERAGILNLGVEGAMLVGALAGFWVSMVTGSPWLGLAAAAGAGAVACLLHGAVCTYGQANQVVSGLALTILATGLANFLGTPYVGLAAPGFDPISIPGLREIPVLGPVFFAQDILVYSSYILPLVTTVGLSHSRWGLRLRAAGESPTACRAAGLSVARLRLGACLVGGMLIGVGGAYLSLAFTHLWTNGITAGRGWIAVALVIFAFWRPGRAMLGAYLFGGVMAFQLRLQAAGTAVPSSLLLMLPYALTIVVLAVSSRWGRFSGAPAALGINPEPSE